MTKQWRYLNNNWLADLSSTPRLGAEQPAAVARALRTSLAGLPKPGGGDETFA